MKKLHLSQTDKKLLGVAGGVAETFDVDPTVVRLAFIFLALITAVVPALITYFIAWMIIPESQTMTRVETE